MKRPSLEPRQREARLLMLARQLMRDEISEGQLLRALRRDVLGLSQDDYARLVGVSRRTLSDLERGQGNATIELLDRVFRPLGLRVGLIPRDPELLGQLINPAD
ncbi:helix-turn-helix transcriptional regulator [Halomonas urumqiensis]|uniref:Transcriptional regulator n=1 Tax=Halomonas urumqiensis TaxID=1684789 RepID=A0A2N7UCD6_9GAMM|nr:helix-turn-helix domain-containing protein [Halomonas urumqiensis]PMR78106.1 transcriptional regulator [Halomonas urumqiensis]PTB03257.1 helix-turn-helix domain-containing protein [Halomonas urumqiensis]GHE20587.1 transcriptional regulator [Halomonas urumqiensis]